MTRVRVFCGSSAGARPGYAGAALAAGGEMAGVMPRALVGT